MTANFTTEQESFWAGNFGDDYQLRNDDSRNHVASQLGLFARIFNCRGRINSVVEFGPNLGLNLDAISMLRPGIGLAGIEINKSAHEKLTRKHPKGQFINGSILDIDVSKAFNKPFDLAFTSGVLIHINPDFLESVYKKLYEASGRYVLVNEYYNPNPVELEYRGHQGKLFKRDFAGELMVKFPDLNLVDYGFHYKGDSSFPGGDTTWFLMEKEGKK